MHDPYGTNVEMQRRSASWRRDIGVDPIDHRRAAITRLQAFAKLHHRAFQIHVAARPGRSVRSSACRQRYFQVRAIRRAQHDLGWALAERDDEQAIGPGIEYARVVSMGMHDVHLLQGARFVLVFRSRTRMVDDVRFQGTDSEDGEYRFAQRVEAEQVLEQFIAQGNGGEGAKA